MQSYDYNICPERKLNWLSKIIMRGTVRLLEKCRRKVVAETIVTGSFESDRVNKNVGSVSSDLRNQVECGMVYTRFLDSQIKALKKKDAIRKTMRIKR